MNDHDRNVPMTGETSWHKITDFYEFVKWQYGDSPYRVIVDLDESRGHWRALFTTWWGPTSYLIKGNCGGGDSGRMVAIMAASSWMDDNKHGCPPPGEM